MQRILATKGKRKEVVFCDLNFKAAQFRSEQMKTWFGKIERQKCSLVTKPRKQRNLGEDKQKRYF